MRCSHSPAMHELSDRDLGLLSEVAPGFTVRQWGGVGLSGHARLAIDTAEGASWFVKIGPPDVLAADLAGDRLLRDYVPTRSMPELVAERSSPDACLIAYRLLKGAKDLDQVRGKSDAVAEVLSVLAPAHGTGATRTRAPEVRSRRLNPPAWPTAMLAVRALAKRATQVRVPWGLIHGDLHGRNILVTGDRSVVIDFTSVGEGCVWRDFAKLETSLRVRGEGDPDAVAVLRSLRDRHGRAAGLDSKEIDIGYRGYLAFFLGRFWSKPNPDEARRRALEALEEVVC